MDLTVDLLLFQLIDIACFSFYPTKSLGAIGDAGMVVTGNAELNEKINMLHDMGRKGRYEHPIKGFNSRLDTIQAVVFVALPVDVHVSMLPHDQETY